MVSLTMMARLLEAVRPGSRLILVGDPFQLASVEAGAVLADLVETVQETTRVGVASLRHLAPLRRVDRRAGRGGPLRATPTRPSPCSRRAASTSSWSTSTTPRAASASWSSRTPSTCCGRPRPATPTRALELLDRQRLLCAHREGPFGVRHWNTQVERWLGEETGEPIWSAWYAGRPLLVTANDYGLGIYNGDTGVAVRPPSAAPAAPSAPPSPAAPAASTSPPAGSARSRPCTR